MARLPIEFQGYRDPKGYRLEGTKPQLITRNGRNGDPLEPCRPLEQTPDLFLIFASSVKTPEGALDFVQRHGALTANGNDANYGENVHRKVLPYAHWMRLLLSANRSHQTPPEELWRDLLGPVRGLVTPVVKIRARAVWNLKIRTVQWRLSPATLLDGLWQQFGNALMGGAKLRECDFCHTWFEVGAGTGRRLDAKFCSEEHKIRFHSLKRSRESSEQQQPRKGGRR